MIALLRRFVVHSLQTCRRLYAEHCRSDITVCNSQIEKFSSENWFRQIYRFDVYKHIFERRFFWSLQPQEPIASSQRVEWFHFQWISYLNHTKRRTAHKSITSLWHGQRIQSDAIRPISPSRFGLVWLRSKAIWEYCEYFFRLNLNEWTSQYFFSTKFATVSFHWLPRWFCRFGTQATRKKPTTYERVKKRSRPNEFSPLFIRTSSSELLHQSPFIRELTGSLKQMARCILFNCAGHQSSACGGRLPTVMTLVMVRVSSIVQRLMIPSLKQQNFSMQFAIYEFAVHDLPLRQVGRRTSK